MWTNKQNSLTSEDTELWKMGENAERKIGEVGCSGRGQAWVCQSAACGGLQAGLLGTRLLTLDGRLIRKAEERRKALCVARHVPWVEKLF